MARQIPSEDVLVVSPAGDPARVRSELAQLGVVEDVEDPGLLLLRMNDPHQGAKAARDRILEHVEDVAWAEPLLVDDRGEAHLPTGDVSVRFSAAPSDDELGEFAAEHGMRVGRRNEFVPEQATFTPLEPRATYLPELLDSLKGAPNVREAWANTMSRYHRAEGLEAERTDGGSRSTS